MYNSFNGGFRLAVVNRFRFMACDKKKNLRSWFAYAALFCAGGLFVSLTLLFVPQFAHAQTDFEAFGTATGLGTASLPVVIARIIRAALMVVGIITVCIVVYGGYLYLLSQGEPAKIDKAKAILKNGAIGLVLIFASYTIASFILSSLLGAAGPGGVITSEADKYYEPLSGSLGRGVINDHYPPRNATDIPRNTNIMITFNEPISVDSMMATGYATDADGYITGYLNTANVTIYPVSDTGTCSGDATVSCTENADCVAEDAGTTCTITSGEEKALLSANVAVSVNNERTIYTFNPVELLGNPLTDTNYVVRLGTGIKVVNDNGTLSAAFTGAYEGGYEWTFEVSTEVDLTPPYVVSVAPIPSTTPYDRNIVVQINFSEAMDPVAATGVFQPTADNFTHIEVVDRADWDSDDYSDVTGTYSISNGYKTVEFVTFDACGLDPCGNTIYCLPASSSLEVFAHAAPVIVGEEPQGRTVGGLYDGLVDAAGNTLDGDNDWGAGTGEAGDDYAYAPPTLGWTFSTSAAVNMTPPKITAMTPSLKQGSVDLAAPVTFTFAAPLMSATVNTQNIMLLPDPDHELWYSLDYETSSNTATVNHGSFLPTIETQQYYYWPVLTHGVKSANQICMFPAQGPSWTGGTPACTDNSAAPICCTGEGRTETGAAADADCLRKDLGTPVYTFE